MLIPQGVASASQDRHAEVHSRVDGISLDNLALLGRRMRPRHRSVWHRISGAAPRDPTIQPMTGFRHALNASTQLHQNSDHGGTCTINAQRRSASRLQWSRLSISRLTEAERNSSLSRASRFIARSCSTSTRNTFISMSNSFSSRRMTGSGSGASHGLRTRKWRRKVMSGSGLIRHEP